MDALPPRTCTIDQLIRNPKLVGLARSGAKIEQRRNGVYGYPGEEFTLEGTRFKITELKQQRLGDMTEADAKNEGYPNLQMYKDIILKMHGNMQWNDDGLVWVHCFSIC